MQSHTPLKVPHIWVSKKLPCQADPADIIAMPINEALERDAVDWIEFPLFSEQFVAHHNVERFRQEFRTHFKNYYDHEQEILDKLILADMPPFGRGIYAREPIKKGTILAIYSGIYKHAKESNSDYDLILSDAKVDQENENLNVEFFCSDSAMFGNLARYFQHAPDPENGDYRKTADFEKIASAKTQFSFANVAGVPVMYVEASEDIDVNEFIGVDYSVGYWKNKNQSPMFFDKFGKALPEVTPYLEWSAAAKMLIEDFGALADKSEKNTLHRNDYHQFLTRLTESLKALCTSDLEKDENAKALMAELQDMKCYDVDILQVLANFLKPVSVRAILNFFVDPLIGDATQDHNLAKVHNVIGKRSGIYDFLMKVKPEMAIVLKNMCKHYDDKILSKKDLFNAKIQRKTPQVNWQLSDNTSCFWMKGSKDDTKKIAKDIKSKASKHDLEFVREKNPEGEYTIRVSI